MAHEPLWLDGNAIAGLLCELFGADFSDAPRTCQSCGQVRAIGEHRLYQGAGLVLRCPVCGDIAALIVTAGSRYMVELRGEWRLEIAAKT